VPLPIGNGEQRFNVAGVIDAGGGLLVDDADLTPEWVETTLLPLLRDSGRLADMARAAASVGERDGDGKLAALVHEVAGRARSGDDSPGPRRD
jgi:UDP-N-acetylglucosamine--N-acetylmuramyl-(pentapeptide) pyrophosphoryl-undecaprenol N-acetylglucosamine transferase